MKFYTLVFSVLSLFSVAACAADLNVNYQYDGKAYDLSAMKKGPLNIMPFSDGRGLTDPSLLSAGGDMVEKPVTKIMHDAMLQAFKANGAILATEDAPLSLSGELMELNVTESGGEVQIQVRASAALKDSSRTRWETVLFSRGSGASKEDAMRDMLDKLVQELLIDDYFVMEIL